MIISSRPTAFFLGICTACVRPVRDRDDRTAGRHACLTCPQCGQNITGERLHTTTNAEPCDGRCMSATGPDCSCGCAGKNHGRLWQYQTEQTESALAAYRQHAAAQQRAAQHRVAARRADALSQFQQWTEDNSDIVAFLGDGSEFDSLSRKPNSFLEDMAHLIARRQRLTDRQAAAVRRCLDARRRIEQTRAAEQAAAKPVPTGTAVTIIGRVLTTRTENNPHGPGSTHRMLIKGDGWRIWSTIPTPLIRATGWNLTALEGRDVRLVAGVTPSDNDPAFGYAKRPRRAELITDQPDTTA